MRALLTGFEPFGGDKLNPSELVIRRFSEVGTAELPGLEIHTTVLPVSFKRAGTLLRDLLDELKPDIYPPLKA
jgi:pyroglutamyl-peptidase